MYHHLHFKMFEEYLKNNKLSLCKDPDEKEDSIEVLQVIKKGNVSNISGVTYVM